MSARLSFVCMTTPRVLAPKCPLSHAPVPESRLRTVNFLAVCGVVLVMASSCSGGARELDASASRPDNAEMMRRARLITAEFGRVMPADADPSTLTCILDEPYGEFGYQLGYEGADPETSAMAAVVACGEDEWAELAPAIATLHQTDDVAGVRLLVARAIEAQMP